MYVCVSLYGRRTQSGLRMAWPPVGGRLVTLAHVRSLRCVGCVCVCVCACVCVCVCVCVCLSLFIWKTDKVGFKDDIWPPVGEGLVTLCHARACYTV